MYRALNQSSYTILACLSIGLFCLEPLAAEEKIDFNRDIRPLLSDTCFTCHGPSSSNREAGLRFDLEKSVYGELESGSIAVVPGDLENSELYQRLVTEDEDLVMPPVDSAKQLTPAQIDLFKKWIEQDAEWENHWSFITPVKPAVPEIKDPTRAKNPIDHFILKKLAEEELTPSPEADKETLIRRVTFDLTGLPPTPAEIDTFLADNSENAYENLVDRLLASPHYGEHMARYWLDAARYGDTHGLHLDNRRSIWPYRDWVITAFNDNMPFDQFTIEQIGGDLLPNPTLSQKVATGFNRCNVTTSEGGSINEEYLVRYASDRVETTGTVWLGLTLNCTVCHEHKYDPISQQEFYQLFAFYNSLTEKAMDGNALLPPPVIKVPTVENQIKLDELAARVAQVQKESEELTAKINYVDPTPNTEFIAPKSTEEIYVDDDEVKDAHILGGPEKGWKFVTAAEGHPVHSGQKSLYRSGKMMAQSYWEGAKNPITIQTGDRFFAYVHLDPSDPPQEIMFQFHTKDTKWDHRAFWGEDKISFGAAGTPAHLKKGPLPSLGEWVRIEVSAVEVGLKSGMKVDGIAMSQWGGTTHWDKLGRITVGNLKSKGFKSQREWELVELSFEKSSELPKDVLEFIKVEPNKRNAQQTDRVKSYFLANFHPDHREQFLAMQNKLATTKKEREEYNKNIPATLIMEDMEKPRQAHLLIRGEYDKKGEKVERKVPAVLPSLPEGAPLNRLGLAQWLVDPKQPLTARVTVNRYWQQYFGLGLVKTTEDFGSQGEWPTHPELLDWLATTFMESGWDIKAFQKLIVMSGTYQQSSKVSPELLKKDPTNRLLARGPRFRLDAEMIRDNALALSGLLRPDIGGPSVKPYQPLGLWKVVGYTSSNTANFKQDEGDALYRRSMYTFWKRTSPPPSMSTFDAPSRETCTVKRERTNTPLQALNLLNDVQFFEASRKFAERMMTEGGNSPKERIVFGYRAATGQFPDEREIQILTDLYQSNLQDFSSDTSAAKSVVNAGDSSRNESLDIVELAAWTMVGNTLMNLDETVTKE